MDPLKPAADGAAPVAPTVEQLQAQLAERDAAIAERDVKLAKAADKEFNFSQVRKLAEMPEAERAALTEREKELMQRQEALEAQTKNFTETQINTHKNDALAAFAGDDKELRDKMAFHYDRIKDSAVTRDEVQSKMREAYLLAVGRPVTADPFSRATSFQGGMAPQNAGGKAEINAEQRDLASRLGITDDEITKYANKK